MAIKPALASLRAGALTLAALGLLLGVGAKPARAWKPKTHIYLAEQALKDAVDDGKVTIYEADYRNGKVLEPIGSFPVEPRILEALKANPKQYRAGVLGPDAYPDIVTGQTLTHPHAGHALDGHQAGGTNSWLTHLWNLSYGPGTRGSGGIQLPSLPGVVRNDASAVRAFVAGYITHAAGDMFAHTYVNHFTGGEFMLTPDPRNAVKHLVFEGYIGKRTPLTIDTFGPSVGKPATTFPGASFPLLAAEEMQRLGIKPSGLAQLSQLPQALAVIRDLDSHLVTQNDVSISGIESYIYRELTFAKPGSVLQKKLMYVDGRNKSLPNLFSELRNSLQKEVDRYYARSKAGQIAYSATHPGRITFIEHWIDDIDKGLRRWPVVSQQVANALVYNELGGGGDIKDAKKAIDDYVKDYLVYMGPVPDIAVDALKFMSSILDALVPDAIKEAIMDLVKDTVNKIAKAATGKTLNEWAEYLSNPETHFDPVMNGAGGEHPGRTAQRITLAGFNRDHLKIQDAGYTTGSKETFTIEQFPPAFNTVQMCKLMLLGKEGVNQLLDALAAKGAQKPTLPANFENVMLGWLQSLDNDNQWQGLAKKDANPNATLIFAQHGGSTYQRLFMKMVGEEEWVTAPPPAGQQTPTPTPSDPTPTSGTGTGTAPPPPGTTTPPGRGTGTAPPTGTGTTAPPPATTGGGDPGTPGGTPPGNQTPPGNGTIPTPSGAARPGDGKFRPLDMFDVRVDEIKMGRGDTLEMWVTYKLVGNDKGGIQAGNFTLMITDVDGLSFRDMGNLYQPKGEIPIRIEQTLWVERGGIGRVRYVFNIPDGVTALQKLTVREHSSKPQTFDLTGVSLTRDE